MGLINRSTGIAIVHKEIQRLIERYPDVEPCLEDVQMAFTLLTECYREGGKMMVCGNGGSAADSEHIVGELMKGFKSRRPLPDRTRARLLSEFPEDGEYLANNLQAALPAISLVSQSALLTAFANDVAPDMVFAQQVCGYGVAGDVVLGISTSGNSRNVVYALETGRALGLRTIGLTGSGGGDMAMVCDVTIRVPFDETVEIQERQFPIYHALCLMLEQEFFPE